MIDKKTIKLLIFFFIAFILFVRCNYTNSGNIVIKEKGIQNFDITPDGRNIIFSYFDNNRISIYKSNIDGSNVKLLINSQDGMVADNPRCSPDGKKIVFVSKKIDSLNSSISVAGINGDNISIVTDDFGLKIQAVFSKDGKSLFFIQANEYSAYSSVGVKAPHNFDIYKYEFGNRKVNRISNLSAYRLYNIEDIDNDRLLFDLRDEKNGIFFYNKFDFSLMRISTSNDTLRNSNDYSNPILVNSNRIVCSSNYDLVNIDLLEKKESLLSSTDGTHFNAVRYNAINQAIYFIKTDDKNVIQKIDLDGKEHSKIILDKFH